MDTLLAISPIDGRYRNITKDISQYFSEYAFIKYRVEVEINWLEFFIKNVVKKEDKDLSTKLVKIVENFSIEEAKRVKEIEKITNHDVKAIEYYVREKLEEVNLREYISYVHFGCTSEDINNIAYGKMISNFLKEILFPKIDEMIFNVEEKAREFAKIPMLAHTHGQIATPTTVGKELAIFVYRWKNTLEFIKRIKLKGKFSGAVGNFNAQIIAFPETNWKKIAKEFVEKEGLEFNELTTQIESHDMISLLFGVVKNFNNITMDFDSDMWLYISNNYFKQKVVKTETGSSVMPHKVNPINFENSMANIRIASSIFDSLSNNLQVSRMQRDLSDSSMLRNIGVAFSHTVIAIDQVLKGFSRLEVNIDVLKRELAEHPEVISEAIQTILRKNRYENSYELLKEFSRGNVHTLEEYRKFINDLEIEENDKKILLELTPEKYVGLAEKLANGI